MISNGRNVVGSDPSQIRRETELVRSSKDDEVLTGDHAVEVSLKNSVEVDCGIVDHQLRHVCS